MIDQLWTFIQQQLQTNNFLSGGAFLMVFGALAAVCRSYPAKLWHWCVQRLFMEFEIPIKDPAFLWFDEWLSRQPYSKNRARWLSVRTQRRGRGFDDDKERPEIILTPAPGIHWLFWRGYFMVVNRERKEADGKSDGMGSRVEREIFNVSILTWKRDVVIRLLEEAREIVMPRGDMRVSVLTPHYGEWHSEIKRKPRPIESVILQAGVMEDLLKDIEWFLASEQWYVDRGIPHRRGYMLYGPPGTGKSSAVMAIASHLRLDIAVLNLNEPSYSDGDIRGLLAEVPERTLVLIEDIDCVFTQREGTDDKANKVTFSGLLNAIDGVVASEGRILFMTSNHPDKLDPALVRPGRCDVKVFIGYADYTQALRLWDRFFPDAPAPLSDKFASAIDGTVSMATLQGHLLKYSNDPEAAIANVGEVYNTIRSSNEPQASDSGEIRTESDVGIQASQC